MIENDGATFFHPRDYFNWVARTQYNKRCKNDPIWVSAIIAGINDKTNEVFLGSSNFHGMKHEADYIITGLGNHYCQVLMANRWHKDITKEDAVALIEDCMKVMFFRDKKAHDLIQISTVTQADGIQIGTPYRIEASTDLQSMYTGTNE